MLGERAFLADDNDTVAAVDQFAAEFDVPPGLGGFVVDGAVTENAHVGGGEGVQNATRLGDGRLGLVGQRGEKGAFDVRTGIGQGTQPGQVGIPIAPCNSREGAAASQIEEVLLEAVVV